MAMYLTYFCLERSWVIAGILCLHLGSATAPLNIHLSTLLTHPQHSDRGPDSHCFWGTRKQFEHQGSWILVSFHFYFFFFSFPSFPSLPLSYDLSIVAILSVLISPFLVPASPSSSWNAKTNSCQTKICAILKTDTLHFHDNSPL